MAPAGMAGRAHDAVLLAGAAMLAALPMFAWQYLDLGGALFSRPPAPDQAWQLAAKQAVMVFALALPCALVGFLYAERLNLPGFGRLADLPRWLGFGLLAGLLLTPFSWLALDHALSAALPQLYPARWPAALADMLGGSLPQEVIARFGLLTIAVYLLRWAGFRGHPWPAIGALALFGSLGSYLFLVKFGLANQLGAGQTAGALLAAFAAQWLYGEIYLRRGLLAAICLHFGLNVKYLVYASLPLSLATQPGLPSAP